MERQNMADGSASSLDLPPQKGATAYALVKDLLTPDWRTYWSDMLISAAVGYSALVLIIAAGAGWLSLAVYPVAVLALYRALLFIHEITHQRGPQADRFRLGWNLLIGHPLMMPSIMYEGIHILHHGKNSYGTPRDPEYMPLAGKRGKMTLVMLALPFHTALVMLRFTVLTVIGWLVPPFRRLLEARFSALTFNLDYVRRIQPKEQAALRKAEVGILLTWAILALAAWSVGVLVWALLAFYLTLTGVNVINGLRTIGGTHLYANEDGEVMSRQAQLADSIDAPEGFLPWLWAPVGLRFHATHHIVPNAPYHNLKEIRRRLVEGGEDAELLTRIAVDGLTDGIGRVARGQHSAILDRVRRDRSHLPPVPSRRY